MLAWMVPLILSFLVFNTLFNLQSQQDQIRLFTNVANRLSPGGTFLIEAFVPEFSSYQENQKVATKLLETDRVWLEAITHDPVDQL